MPLHPLTNGLYLRNNLSKIQDRAYEINPEEYESTGKNWNALYLIDDNVSYFDSFGVKSILQKIENS